MSHLIVLQLFHPVHQNRLQKYRHYHQLLQVQLQCQHLHLSSLLFVLCECIRRQCFCSISNFFSNRFLLGDTFGDGWNSASFYRYDNTGDYIKTSSTCEDNVVIDQYCFDPYKAKIGDWVTATVFGFRAVQSWEILWQAIILSENGKSKSVYIGSLLASMTFVYSRHDYDDIQTSYIKLIDSKNTLPDEMDWLVFLKILRDKLENI